MTELVIAVAVIALLVGILVPMVSRAREAARVVQCTSNLKQISSSFGVWGQKNSMRLPDTSNWITAVKVGSKDGRILYCPDGAGPSDSSSGFDKQMITHNKAYNGNGHPAPVWTPDPTTTPNANFYTVDIRYQNSNPQHPEKASFEITRISGNMWKLFAKRIDPGGNWGGPPINMTAGGQSWLDIQQGQTIIFLFGDAGTNYGFNIVMGNVLAPKPSRVLAMDYDKMLIDYSGDADDDSAATYLKIGRHNKGARINALLTDGSVQLLTLKELSPTSTLMYLNK